MKKTSLPPVLILSFIFTFASAAIAQMTAKGWEKTVTLPSGEVILNISGEWDEQSEGYGPFSFLRLSPEILTITQEGTTFIAIKQIGSKWVPKGAETIKGELDKNGFKVVYSYMGLADIVDPSFVWEECQWEISEEGNKIDLDCGERIKRTLTRK
jgi:hypothetical protein